MCHCHLMRTAIYARVSTSHHSQDPQVQLYELREFCSKRGFSIDHEVIDHGFSGGTAQRPGFKELMALANSGKIDLVIVLKLDRLFRSLKHLITTLEEFDILGIKFIAVRDNVDWTTPSGRFFVQVLGSFAELERSILRERTILGLENAKRKGKRLGRPSTVNGDEIRRLKAKGLSDKVIQYEMKVSKGSIYRAVTGLPKKVVKKEECPE